MKRASWSGNFRLGNLVIPAKLYAATTQTSPDFVQVHKDDLAPVKRQLICSEDSKELSTDDIVRAVRHEGRYVPVPNADEIESHVGRDIVVKQFADVRHVHSLYYDKPYYVVPAKDGEMAYAILRNALKKADKIAVVTYSLYGRAHIGIIGPSDGVMILQQLKYATEVVDKRDIKMPSLPQPSPGQLDVAVRLIDKYTTDFYLDDYRNEQLDAVHELVERTIKGLPEPKRHIRGSTATPEAEVSSRLAGLLEGKDSITYHTSPHTKEEPVMGSSWYATNANNYESLRWLLRPPLALAAFD